MKITRLLSTAFKLLLCLGGAIAHSFSDGVSLTNYLVAHPNTHVTFNLSGGEVRELVAQIHNDGSLQITTGIRRDVVGVDSGTGNDANA